MSDPRHPDIEIYVKNCSLEQLEHWLRDRCSVLEKQFSQGQIHEYRSTIDDATVPVMIHEKVVGKAWTSVWFKSADTPWPQDIDCALEASRALDTQIRCIVGGWSNGQDPDEWWRVENGQQEKIQWRTVG